MTQHCPPHCTHKKDVLYENLASIIRNIPSKEQVALLGDFNARVGADHDSWPSCLCQLGLGKMNENGHNYWSCAPYMACALRTPFFRTKPQHKVSWRHPRSKHWHQLYIILVRRAAIKNVLYTRSYHCADCDTDHSLMCCKIRMHPKKFHRTKKNGNPRIAYRCQQDVSTRPHGAVRSDLREGIWHLATR